MSPECNTSWARKYHHPHQIEVTSPLLCIDIQYFVPSVTNSPVYRTSLVFISTSWPPLCCYFTQSAVKQLRLVNCEVVAIYLKHFYREPMATRDQRPMTIEDLRRQQQQQEIPSVPDMDDPQPSGAIPPDMSFDEQECNQVDLDLDVHRPPVLGK